MAQDIRFRVLSLDVWGHSGDDCEALGCSGDCGGYEVNDRSYAGSVYLTDNATDADLLRRLQEARILAPHVTLADLAIDWPESDYATIDQAFDGYPLLQIERDPG